ncbi:MAG: hypothetical protein LBM96_01960 [Methanobrevibacter sp.]|jgi:hypothetical protein|nr:hypothetical protein [Candidatus Methanoflexus mossambicus]
MKTKNRILGMFMLVVMATMLISTGYAASDMNITNTTESGINGVYNQLEDTGGVIYLKNGVYSGENNTNLSFDKNITVIGESSDKTIIDAGNLSQIFRLNSSNSYNFVNITFANVNSNAYFDSLSGGALVVTGESKGDNYINISDCRFVNNSGNFGGAIFNDCDIIFIINNSSFNNNYAYSSGGGAIYSSSRVKVSNSKFDNSLYGKCVINVSYSNVTNSYFANLNDIYGLGNSFEKCEFRCFGIGLLASGMETNAISDYSNGVYSNGLNLVVYIGGDFYSFDFNHAIVSNVELVFNNGFNDILLSGKFNGSIFENKEVYGKFFSNSYILLIFENMV